MKGLEERVLYIVLELVACLIFVSVLSTVNLTIVPYILDCHLVFSKSSGLVRTNAGS